MTVEQMEQKMAEAKETKKKEYAAEYRALNEKYGMCLVPQMILREGAAPVVQMSVEELQK